MSALIKNEFNNLVLRNIDIEIFSLDMSSSLAASDILLYFFNKISVEIIPVYISISKVYSMFFWIYRSVIRPKIPSIASFIHNYIMK